MLGEPKSYTRTLSGPKEKLQILAMAANKDWSFYILHKRADGTTARGASARCANLQDAQARVDSAVRMAVQLGWSEREPSQGRKNLGRSIREPKIYDPKKGRR